LRDAYAKRGLSKATIHRAFNVIRAILNFVSREHDLPEIRTFSGVFLGDDIINAPQKRIPIPTTTILKVQKLCQKENDEITRLVALISDTGMRLSEAAGLLKTDIHVDQKHPYIYLKPHKWRRLKTSDSERVIPLVGVSLWAASTAYENTSNDFLFPKFCNAYECKGGVASTTLNKWMSQHVPKGCVIHSFRHSLRDRLRAVQCPPDIIDRIGGWTVGGVGEGYGSGYPVDVLHKWMLTMIKNKKDVPHRTLKTL
jgi:integrase